MDRETLNDRLLDYLYGELTPAERESYEQGLATAPDLRAEVAALADVRTAFQALPTASPAEETLAAILDQARAHAACEATDAAQMAPSPSSGWVATLLRGLLRPAVGAAFAVLLVVVTSVFVIKNQTFETVDAPRGVPSAERALPAPAPTTEGLPAAEPAPATHHEFFIRGEVSAAPASPPAVAVQAAAPAPPPPAPTATAARQAIAEGRATGVAGFKLSPTGEGGRTGAAAGGGSAATRDIPQATADGRFGGRRFAPDPDETGAARTASPRRRAPTEQSRGGPTDERGAAQEEATLAPVADRAPGDGATAVDHVLDDARGAYEAGRYAEAAERFQDVLRQAGEPATEASARVGLARSQRQQHVLDDSLANYNRALELLPDAQERGALLLERAEVEIALGQRAATRQTLQSLVADPTYGEAARDALRRLDGPSRKLDTARQRATGGAKPKPAKPASCRRTAVDLEDALPAGARAPVAAPIEPTPRGGDAPPPAPAPEPKPTPAN